MLERMLKLSPKSYILVWPFTYTCRDFQTVDETLLTPIIEAMKPVANISVESQVIVLLFLLKMVMPLHILVL